MGSKTDKESLFRKLCRKLSPKKTDKHSLPSMIGFEDARHSCTHSSSSSSSSNGNDELQMVFNYFDENGDGKISAAELQSCVTILGGGLSSLEAEEAVKLSDLDGDGLLDFDEFHKLIEGEGSSQEDRDCELKEAFVMYSTKGSDCITPASLKRMLCRLGEFKSLDDCKAMIRTFDLNGDGVLSFDEFVIMMS